VPATQDRTHFVDEQQRKQTLERIEQFDRVAFAMQALRVLRPHATKVAVYPCRSRIRVEQGRDLEQGPDARWATIGIPGDATREMIVVALVELAGAEPAPYLLDTLLALAHQRAPLDGGVRSTFPLNDADRSTT
jgi:hypothetical protein